MVEFLSSLRFRLIVLVLLAVIPAVGLILLTAARQRALTAGEVQRNALRAARVIATEQERVLESAHQLLITLSGFPQVRKKIEPLATGCLRDCWSPCTQTFGLRT
jgi:hypothetical protein